MKNELHIKVFEEDGLRSCNPNGRLMSYTDYESICLTGQVIGVLQEYDFDIKEEIRLYEAVSSEESD